MIIHRRVRPGTWWRTRAQGAAEILTADTDRRSPTTVLQVRHADGVVRAHVLEEHYGGETKAALSEYDLVEPLKDGGEE